MLYSLVLKFVEQFGRYFFEILSLYFYLIPMPGKQPSFTYLAAVALHSFLGITDQTPFILTWTSSATIPLVSARPPSSRFSRKQFALYRIQIYKKSTKLDILKVMKHKFIWMFSEGSSWKKKFTLSLNLKSQDTRGSFDQI